MSLVTYTLMVGFLELGMVHQCRAMTCNSNPQKADLSERGLDRIGSMATSQKVATTQYAAMPSEATGGSKDHASNNTHPTGGFD